MARGLDQRALDRITAITELDDEPDAVAVPGGAARDPLVQSLELARACGAAGLEQRAGDELRATGARPRSLVYTGVDALTASERRVAELAADGHPNPEIAQALFVTRKTIEAHLSSVYAKLDISSRRALPAALGRTPPGEPPGADQR